eukprot:1073881-Amphidinium_carterae.1
MVRIPKPKAEGRELESQTGPDAGPLQAGSSGLRAQDSNGLRAQLRAQDSSELRADSSELRVGS